MRSGSGTESELHTYAVLGGYDFHLAFEIKSGDAAFQVSQAIERRGLDAETMRALLVENIDKPINDI